jgi:hypothetical protein
MRQVTDVYFHSGAWIVFPAYMIYVLGEEIVLALESAPARLRPGRPKSS